MVSLFDSISNYHLCPEFETKPQSLKQWLHLSTDQPPFLENLSCIRTASINIFAERQSLHILPDFVHLTPAKVAGLSQTVVFNFCALKSAKNIVALMLFQGLLTLLDKQLLSVILGLKRS